jgi:hypothetical protein
MTPLKLVSPAYDDDAVGDLLTRMIGYGFSYCGF